ncbi:hypothetical protein [Emticicia sp.]|uniref:hypothetical protein n=1 Tax=Emticicia sp. TaxID=1930953 RepID=UPI0037515178
MFNLKVENSIENELNQSILNEIIEKIQAKFPHINKEKINFDPKSGNLSVDQLSENELNSCFPEE